MPDQLLATKFHIPCTRAHLVARPRLIDRLDDGTQLDHRLTLVSAPPGSGKTTLVASWIHHASSTSDRLQTCWLSLDQGDNTLSCFGTYFVSALQTANPHIGAVARAVLESSQPEPIETVLVSLINDVAALAERAILVLDDYHDARNSPRARLFCRASAAQSPFGDGHPRRPAALARPTARAWTAHRNSL
jgi:LuxR family maltose regulon positive regulatory protein